MTNQLINNMLSTLTLSEPSLRYGLIDLIAAQFYLSEPITARRFLAGDFKLYALLTKGEVKMAGYCPTSLCVFIDRENRHVKSRAGKIGLSSRSDSQ